MLGGACSAGNVCVCVCVTSTNLENQLEDWQKHTLQETNISHLWKRKIIFKSALGWDMLIPWRVYYVYTSHINISCWWVHDRILSSHKSS